MRRVVLVWALACIGACGRESAAPPVSVPVSAPAPVSVPVSAPAPVSAPVPVPVSAPDKLSADAGILVARRRHHPRVIVDAAGFVVLHRSPRRFDSDAVPGNCARGDGAIAFDFAALAPGASDTTRRVLVDERRADCGYVEPLQVFREDGEARVQRCEFLANLGYVECVVRNGHDETRRTFRIPVEVGVAPRIPRAGDPYLPNMIPAADLFTDPASVSGIDISQHGDHRVIVWETRGPEGPEVRASTLPKL